MSTTARQKTPDGGLRSREKLRLHAPPVDRPSFSSGSDSSNCAVCNYPERVPLKRLVQCPKCKRRCHLSCHNPPLRKVPDLNEWVCSRCLKSSTMDRTGPSKLSNSYRFVQKVCARCPRLMNTFGATLCLMCSNAEKAQKSRAKHTENMKLSSVAAPTKTSSQSKPSSRQLSYFRPTLSTESKNVLTEPKEKRKHELISKTPRKLAEQDKLRSSSLPSSRKGFSLSPLDIEVNVAERKNIASRGPRNSSQPVRQHNDAPVSNPCIQRKPSVDVPQSKVKPVQESPNLNIGNVEHDQRNTLLELLKFEVSSSTAKPHRDEPQKLKSYLANGNVNLTPKIVPRFIDSSDGDDEDDGRHSQDQIMATGLETKTPLHSSSPNITVTASISNSPVSIPRHCLSESEDNLELSTSNQMDLAPNKYRSPQVIKKGLWVKTLDLDGIKHAVNRESRDDIMAVENESLFGQTIKLEHDSSPAFPKEKDTIRFPSIYDDADPMENEAMFSRMIKLKNDHSPRLSVEKDNTRSPTVDNEESVFYGISNMADDDASDEIMLLKYEILSDLGLEERSEYLSRSPKSEFRTSEENVSEIEANKVQETVLGHTCAASHIQNPVGGPDVIDSAALFPTDESWQLISLFPDKTIPQRLYDVTRIDKFLYAESEATCDQNKEWLEQKRQEIAARPRRKSLFGKIKRRNVSRIEETANISEEWTPLKNLFGLPEKLEPVLFNGQLAMAEPRKANSRGIVPRLTANKVWVV